MSTFSGLSSWPYTLGHAFSLLSLALMVGGMLALGAFSAPIIFKVFNRVDAGLAMTTIFRRYDVVLLIALGLLALGEGLKLWVGPALAQGPTLAWVRLGLIALLMVALGLSLGWLNPRMERAQAEGIAELAVDDPKAVAFAQLHQRSEQLYKLQLLLAVLALTLTPFTQAAWARQAHTQALSSAYTLEPTEHPTTVFSTPTETAPQPQEHQAL